MQTGGGGDDNRSGPEPTTLRRRLTEDGPLSPKEASALLDELATLVDGIHQDGEPHGAISPESVLLLPDGKVRLQSGAAAGAYYSPETAWGEAPTRALDIWALGALLYEMLTGLVPLPAIHPATLSDPGARWGARRLPGAAACAQAVVDRALQRPPAARYPSAQAMANALWESLPHPTSDPSRVGSPAQGRPAVALGQAVNRPLRLSAEPRLTSAQPSAMQRMFATVTALRASAA